MPGQLTSTACLGHLIVGPPCPLSPCFPSSPLCVCLILFYFVSFSFRPLLPVSYVQSELAFESEEECQLFLAPLSLAYAGADTTKIDCKQSLAVLSNF